MYPRLVPEHNFGDMLQGCKDFAACFEPHNFPKIETAIKEMFPYMKATLQDQFLASSDSAGALWLTITLLSHPNVNIRSALYICPMAGKDVRKLGLYRGKKISAQEAKRVKLA